MQERESQHGTAFIMIKTSPSYYLRRRQLQAERGAEELPAGGDRFKSIKDTGDERPPSHGRGGSKEPTKEFYGGKMIVLNACRS